MIFGRGEFGWGSRLSRKAFLAAVVSPDGERATDAQEHIDAVVGYDLNERGICAGQRKVARAHRNGTTYVRGSGRRRMGHRGLEGRRCPRDDPETDSVNRRSCDLVGAVARRALSIPRAG